MKAPNLLLAAVEQALGRYLALDSEAGGRIAALYGKVLCIELRGFDIRLYLVPGPEGIQLLGQYEGEPDATLSGTPLALARLGLPGTDSADELFAGGVQISGDTELGQRFGALLKDIDIDWEEQLARVVGDLAAHQVGNVVRGGLRWGAQARESLGLDLKEYLQEELRLLPVRPEIESFLAEVDGLRDDVERLAARVERLRGHGAKRPK